MVGLLFQSLERGLGACVQGINLFECNKGITIKLTKRVLFDTRISLIELETSDAIGLISSIAVDVLD